MARALKKNELKAFTFMGLLASEGQIPDTAAQSADTAIFTLAAEELVREVASDLTAKGDFFGLMVENGQMPAEAPTLKYNIKIVRPVNLGGSDFGGMFGGGALAH